MTRPRRLTKALMLLVTLLVTGLAPGSWSCPDGTACVYTAGRGFHCAGDECQRPCCELAQPRAGCGTCRHGALPLINASSPQTQMVGEVEDCCYRDTAQLQPARLTAPEAPVFHRDTHAALLPSPVLPVPAPLWQRPAPIRGSPLSSCASPAASPRAPPRPDCV